MTTFFRIFNVIPPARPGFCQRLPARAGASSACAASMPTRSDADGKSLTLRHDHIGAEIYRLPGLLEVGDTDDQCRAGLADGYREGARVAE